MSKILPISLQQNYNSFFFHALPICALQTEENFNHWAAEHLINLCYDSDHMIYEGQLACFGGLNCSWMDCEYIPSSSPETDICRSLEERITKGEYAYIMLDEYFVSTKPSYQNQHFLHDSLIYGFDDAERMFLAVSYFGGSPPLQPVKIPYEELAAAYEGANQYPHDCSPVYFSINGEAKAFCPSPANFLHQLISYLNGIPTVAHPSRQSRFVYCRYGIECIPVWLREIATHTSVSFLDFQNMHAIYEQKKTVHRQLLRMSQSLAEVYHPILRTYENLRMLFLKCLYQSKRENWEIDRKRFLQSMQKAYETEKELLFGVVETMRFLVDASSIEVFSPIREGDFVGVPDLFTDAVVTTEDILPGEGMRYGKRVTIRLETARNVRCVLMNGVERIRVQAGETMLRRSTVRAVQKPVHMVELHQTLQELCIEVESNEEITLESLGIRVYQESVTFGAAVTASSCWDYEEGLPKANTIPVNGVTYNPTEYWNARPGFAGDERLTVSFAEPKSIRRVIVRERYDSQRIRAYEILVEENGVERRLAVHRGAMEGKRMIHEIPAVKAEKLILRITETESDAPPFNEPGISNLEAYG